MEEEIFDYEYLFRFDPANGGAFQGASREQRIVYLRNGRQVVEVVPPEPIDEAEIPAILEGINTAAIARVAELTQLLSEAEDGIELLRVTNADLSKNLADLVAQAEQMKNSTVIDTSEIIS